MSLKTNTREERQEKIERAMAFASLGGVDPSKNKEFMELIQKYIDGEMELEEIKAQIIKKYKGESENGIQ